MHFGGAGDHEPTWSPDGTKIAFTRLTDGGDRPTDLMVMDADGQNLHRLTGTADWRKVLQAPAWRPIPSSGELASIRVNISSTPVAAGSPVTVTATALNGLGQRMTGYNAPATWSDTSDDLSPATPASFVNGVSTTTATLPTPVHAGAIMVTSGGVTGLSGPFDVLGPFAAIRVGVPASAMTTVPFTVQATATDSAGNTLTTYNAPATWSALGGGLTPAAPADFVNGVSTTTNATFATAYANDRITVTSGGIGGQSGQFNVIGPASIAVTVTTPVTAGAPTTVKAIARDSLGHTMTAYNGFATWSDLTHSLSPSAPARFAGGISSTQATIATPSTGDRITLTSGVSGQSSQFRVIGPLSKIVVQKSAAVYAGVPFALKATAVDSAGNTIMSYNASATWSDLSGQLSPAAPSAFSKGVSTTQATVSVPYKGDRITVTSGGISGQLGPFPVYGPLAKISVSFPTPVTHGVPFTVKALALDSAGNTIPYNSSATWSSVSGGLLPATPNAFSKGVSSTAATFSTASPNNRITINSGGISGPERPLQRLLARAMPRRLPVRVLSAIAAAFVSALLVQSAGSSELTVVPPTQIWLRAYDGPGHGNDVAEAAAHAGGKMFVTGGSYVGSGSSAGYDCTTVAYDGGSGKQLWASRYGPGVSAGGIGIVASRDGTKVFVSATSDRQDSSNQDYVTIAYSAASGERLWVSRYETAEAHDVPTAIGLKSDGSMLFVTGSSGGSINGPNEYQTVAYNTATGQRLWVRRYSGIGDPYNVASSLALDKNGTRVVVTGTSNDSGTVSSPTYADYATVAYDGATGQQLWVRRYNDPANGDDSARAVTVAGGKAVVTGESFQQVNFDYQTVAYDLATGATVWERSYNLREEDSANAIVARSDGTMVFVGGSAGVVAYSGAGTQLWASTLGLETDAYSLILNGAGKLIAAGRHFSVEGYDASTGAVLWATVDYDQGCGDSTWANSVAANGTGSKVFVTGVACQPVGVHTDYRTVAYQA